MAFIAKLFVSKRYKRENHDTKSHTTHHRLAENFPAKMLHELT